jgi:phage shock protein E
MLRFLKTLLSGSKEPAADIRNLLKEQHAVIVDVRTPFEFQQGHGEKARNIPLHEIKKNLSELKKLNKPIVTCCRSGNRSKTAASILREAGIEAYNGGSWQNVQEKLKS